MYCRNVHVLIKLAVGKDFSSNKEQYLSIPCFHNVVQGGRTAYAQENHQREDGGKQTAYLLQWGSNF